MSRMSLCLVLCSLLGTSVFVGCQPTDSTSDSDKSGEHDHDHDHDHGPAGPHGGHTESFDQPGYAFEWIHDDSKQLVTIVILDEAKKEEVAVNADSVTMTSKAGQDPQTFTLAAVSPDADGKTSKFEIKDGALIVAIGLGVDVEVEIDGTKFTKHLEPHDHHDH